MSVLLFAKPEAEAVRLWPVVAGQLASAAIAVACLQVLGPSSTARAAAMAGMLAFMMWADCVHPPGGGWDGGGLWEQSAAWERWGQGGSRDGAHTCLLALASQRG